jgi:hypothetical protein
VSLGRALARGDDVEAERDDDGQRERADDEDDDADARPVIFGPVAHGSHERIYRPRAPPA